LFYLLIFYINCSRRRRVGNYLKVIFLCTVWSDYNKAVYVNNFTEILVFNSISFSWCNIFLNVWMLSGWIWNSYCCAPFLMFQIFKYLFFHIYISHFFPPLSSEFLEKCQRNCYYLSFVMFAHWTHDYISWLVQIPCPMVKFSYIPTNLIFY